MELITEEGPAGRPGDDGRTPHRVCARILLKSFDPLFWADHPINHYKYKMLEQKGGVINLKKIHRISIGPYCFITSLGVFDWRA